MTSKVGSSHSQAHYNQYNVNPNSSSFPSTSFNAASNAFNNIRSSPSSQFGFPQQQTLSAQPNGLSDMTFAYPASRSQASLYNLGGQQGVWAAPAYTPGYTLPKTSDRSSISGKDPYAAFNLQQYSQQPSRSGDYTFVYQKTGQLVSPQMGTVNISPVHRYAQINGDHPQGNLNHGPVGESYSHQSNPRRSPQTQKR
jgi:hypothetical protein